MRIPRVSTLALSMGILAGCAYNTGTNVDPGKLATLQRGRSTLADTVRTLGPPDGTTVNADGTKTTMYMYSSSKVHAASFIPIAGAFVGGADSKTGSTILQFDRNDVLTDYSSSTGGTSSTRSP